MKCSVKTVPEPGSCLLFTSQRMFTTLRWSSRWLLWHGALSLRCHHGRSQQQTNLAKIYVSSSTVLLDVINIQDSCWKSGQIQSKIWQEPDFVKMGRMPDLPESGPKSGTSLIITNGKFWFLWCSCSALVEPLVVLLSFLKLYNVTTVGLMALKFRWAT